MLQPMYDRLIVSRDDAGSQMSEGGFLHIPDTAKQKPNQATVVAVGPGKELPDGTLRPLRVAVGDVVMFTKFAGVEVKYEGQDYLIIREDDVQVAIPTAPKSKKANGK